MPQGTDFAMIPTGKLAEEFGVHRRSLARWIKDPTLGFPRPRVINHRLYFERGAIETSTVIKAAGE
jgi:hypothetical protein